MLRKIFFSLMLCVACGLLLTGCGTTEPTSNSNNSNTTNANNTAIVTSSPATAPVATTGDKIGVAECDDYLAKYEACVTGKVPEAARAQYNASLAQVRKSWRDLAANPQTKASLAAACKTASDSAKQTFKSFGCDF